MAGKPLKEPHHWWFWKKGNITYCRKCGLVWLKNRATEKAINASCPDDVDV